jgi:hypothetical protein
MGKLIGALAVVAALAVSNAEAIFLGTVTSGAQVQVNVGTPPTNPGSTATTVTMVKKGKLAARTSATQPGAASQLVFTPPRSSRVIIQVDAPAGGTAAVSVIQGATMFQQAVSNEGHLVLDATP